MISLVFDVGKVMWVIYRGFIDMIRMSMVGVNKIVIWAGVSCDGKLTVE